MNFSFEPTKFEAAWTQAALDRFYEDGWLTDVLYRVKGGKEATVYCCKARAETGMNLLAAKIYRHRRLRAMKNYAVYREGRHITSDKRLQRALKKKTRRGQQLETAAWLDHEYQTLDRLYWAGANVPQPLAEDRNAILMEYVGDENTAAPTLHEVTLGDSEARSVFDRLMENVERMLACDCIHGDLSAFNVLYWEGDFRIIDLPQAVHPMENPSALVLLARDIERLCQYFSRYGIETRPVALADDLWRRYMQRAL